ncbi:hypothetical protein SO802_025528 [Lithocarpus litseifolius]|uniref:Uncharacterized protein n=1 Tax=Lithocarpus litseifolius TaxID=425828 RepID=A0AAW2BZ68_9ROSI
MERTRTSFSCVISNGGLLYAEDLVQETPASGNGRAEDLVQETPASSNVRKTRGTTVMQRIWSLPPNLKIECGLNVRGQPIGESGQTFKRWLGTFCLSRALCPLVPVAWTRVPHKNKEDSWIEIEKRWIIDPEIIHPANQMNWAMHLLGELLRNRRTKLKKKCYPKDALKEEVIEKKPDWADTQDYAVLVDYWFDPDTQAKESGQAVERATVFLKVYCTKDGSPVSNTVKEKIDKMTEILDNGCTLQGERREGILWAKDDAFAQVMGAERSGRVRGVGFGPTPSGRSGANLPCYTLTLPSSTETAQRMTSLENSHQSLRDQLAQSEQKHKEEITELHAKHEEQIAEALSEAKRQSDAQHKKHMDEMMSSMRAMLDRLTPGVDFSGSLRCLVMRRRGALRMNTIKIGEGTYSTVYRARDGYPYFASPFNLGELKFYVESSVNKLDEAERFWFAFVLFSIKRLSEKNLDSGQQGSDDNGYTLCQILRAAKLKYVSEPSNFLYFVIDRFVAYFGVILIFLFFIALWPSSRSFLSLLLRLVQL